MPPLFLHSVAGRDRRAFSLLEVVTVVAIIALLAGLVVGVAGNAIATGRVSRARAELAALAAALEQYRCRFGDYPQTDDAARLLQSLLGRSGPTGDVLQSGPLLDLARFSASAGPDSPPVLLDPWGRPYVYIYKMPPEGWTNPTFILYSLGADGADSARLLPGGIPDPTLPGNADNIFADGN